MRSRASKLVLNLVPLLLIAAAAVVAATAAQPAAAAADPNWPMYLNNATRTGFAAGETAITPSTAPSMKLHWSVHAGGSVSAEPITANGNVYWGSWDGYEHSSSTSGTPRWQTYIGTNTDSNCMPKETGVASSATVGTVKVGGTATSVDFVGGGNGYFYALNAATGAVIWKQHLGSTPAHFLWSSPLLHGGSVYEGVSSFGDCPLVRGEMVKMNATTGAIQHTFYTVPGGCIGAGVWGSATLDPTSGNIYFGTGNAGSCGSSEPLAVAVVKLNSSLSLVGHWQIPSAQHGPDSDFGSTPTMFTATIGGTSTPMVGLQNKNGIYYAFRRGSLGAGPAWKSRIASAGECPQCGKGDIPPSAFDGSSLYIAGGNTHIGGTFCAGSLQALDPASGHLMWQKCLTSGPVLGAVTAVPGVAFVADGQDVLAVSTSTGGTLFSYTDSAAGSAFWGPASISNGVVYIGNQDGLLDAFGG
ncbi:MAG: outer membrane protein assembly factor BamB family protein [Streptosporangiaceae bacterium]